MICAGVEMVSNRSGLNGSYRPEAVVAPIRLEKALQALHGARPWEPTFRQLEYERVKRSDEIP